jgi:hypothetical protein
MTCGQNRSENGGSPARRTLAINEDYSRVLPPGRGKSEMYVILRIWIADTLRNYVD